MTYNIRKGKGASGRSTTAFDDLTHALRARAPDVVLVQEVFHPSESEDKMQQSTELATRLGMTSFYEPNKRRRVGHHGNATFTRYAIVDSQNYDISTNRFERRGALYARLDVGGRPLHVLNVHLGLNQRQRLHQVGMIGDIVAARVPKEEAMILAGDFNDWNRFLDPIVQRDLGVENSLGTDVQRARTWPARRPVFCLDRVYVRNVQTHRTTRLMGEPWTELSDHLPLWVELEV
ncbi:MAG: endonuclease/exonuclease/phosphatase family protein [Clostridia bacterium]|nr:endonuclease/exonuclease/phosphatase family protein [Deltaproteobacteria bacterium]